jgi:hypothetical protein
VTFVTDEYDGTVRVVVVVAICAKIAPRAAWRSPGVLAN